MNAPIRVRGLRTCFGRKCIHEGLGLEVRQGEVLGIMGGSGAGKTVLLHEMIMLRRPTAGCIELFGQDLERLSPGALNELRKRMGVMFQQGALLSSMDLLDNCALPLREHTRLTPGVVREVARLKLALVGLPVDAARKFPREISGGMLKRAAVARALALDPELLFLDEPTAGLDPVSAEGIDRLILDLKRDLGLTVVMVSHDLDSLWRVTDRVAFLGERRVLAVAPMAELAGNEHPAITAFLRGPRGRHARACR